MIQEQLKALTLIGGMSLALLTADIYAEEKASTITATLGVAAGGDIRNNEIIINQYSLDQLRQMLKEEVQGGTSDKADKLSLELAVNKKALLGFFKILKQENVPPENSLKHWRKLPTSIKRCWSGCRYLIPKPRPLKN